MFIKHLSHAVTSRRYSPRSTHHVRAARVYHVTVRQRITCSQPPNPASGGFFKGPGGGASYQSVTHGTAGRRQGRAVAQPITRYAILLGGRGRGFQLFAHCVLRHRTHIRDPQTVYEVRPIPNRYRSPQTAEICIRTRGEVCSAVNTGFYIRI